MGLGLNKVTVKQTLTTTRQLRVRTCSNTWINILCISYVIYVPPFSILSDKVPGSIQAMWDRPMVLTALKAKRGSTSSRLASATW